MIVERYQDSQMAEWEQFMLRSRNAPFQFQRAYMDYHRNRFEDYSLVVRYTGGSVAAMMPAHRRGSALLSHMGLTYGGFAIGEDMRVDRMLQVFAATIRYLQAEQFSEWIYKTIPHIYHKAPSEEDRFALRLCQPEWLISSPSCVVPPGGSLRWQERRTRAVKKAGRYNVDVQESDDLPGFWRLLEENLMALHGTKPVHSISEIERLRASCPGHIRLFAAFQGQEMTAGVLIYDSARVAHVQYIASNGRARETGALDLIFHVLLTNIYSEKAWFDFGTSSENSGKAVNAGLLDQKEGFGARAMVQDWYRIDLKRVRAEDLLAAAV